MHVDFNLDDFEYEEKSREVKVPYIISIDEGSGEILSIYRNYDMEDQLMKRKIILYILNFYQV